MICPRSIPSALARMAAVLACFAFGAPALGQDVGDAMQVYERAENQMKKLNKLVPMAEKQTVAVTIAIKNLGTAKTPDAVEAARRKALDAFRANERSLENLSRAIQDLAESFEALHAVKESKAAEQHESRLRSLVNLEAEISKLAEGDFGVQRSEQQRRLTQLLTHLQDQGKGSGDAGSSANLQRAGEILSRLSVMVEVAKIRNDVNRTLVLAIAAQREPAE